MAKARPQDRCPWPGEDPLMIAYHDREWGVPIHDDRRLFECLVLGGAQAGLSWRIILHKREGYRAAFADFDPAKVVRFSPKKIARLLTNDRIVRNRLKVASAVTNARAVLEVQDEFGSFDAYLWQFVDGRPIVNRWRRLKDLPPRSRESDTLSKDLKQRGFAFVGSTICYATMQAAGLVNDHLVTCFRYGKLARPRAGR